MNKSDNSYVLRWTKKIKAIELLGGKCEHCGEINIFKLCFHHNVSKEKEECIKNLSTYRWSVIEQELLKCTLLCNNCHFELHQIIDNSKNVLNKKTFLEFKNKFKCDVCGFDKYSSSLIFHHTHDKKFQVCKVTGTYKTLNMLTEEIKHELDKCNVLCANCHIQAHTDIKRFDMLKHEIYNRVGSHKERRTPLDKDEILKMYNSGMRQTDIVAHFGCAKSTISNIIKCMT